MLVHNKDREIGRDKENNLTNILPRNKYYLNAIRLVVAILLLDIICIINWKVRCIE